MNDRHQFPLEKETRQIVGCAMTVLNTLGRGLFEKVYENALTVDFLHHGIPFEQQKAFEVRYRGVSIGRYIPDLVVFGKVIVETKTLEHIGPAEWGQVLNYLKLTGRPVGLILNFKHSRLEWKRIILSENLTESLNEPKT
jgi:GxxExxY protein